MESEIAEYLAAKRRRSPATQSQYRFVLESVWLPWCEERGVEVARLATDKVMDRFTATLEEKRWLTNRKEEKRLSVQSVRTYVRSVRLFLNWAGTPKGRYEQPRAPQRLLETLTRQEIETLEKAALDERDRLIIRVLADSGVRVSELLGLRPEDLRENKHDRTHAIRVVGKGNREREVPLPPATFVRLKRFADGNAERGHIFSAKRRSRTGTIDPLTRAGVEQMIRNLGTVAAIPKRIYPHLLRHSYATWKLSKGMNPVMLMKILGHKNLTMIAQVYSHLVLVDTYAAMMATED